MANESPVKAEVPPEWKALESIPRQYDDAYERASVTAMLLCSTNSMRKEFALTNEVQLCLAVA
jgi:hypothetical protein